MTNPLAIIPVYNEYDILPAVIQHLKSQGCDVHIIDNWSSDLPNNFEELYEVTSERWPNEKPTKYDWTGILKRIEEVALERGQGRWVIFHDADEIRRPPTQFGECTLKEALEFVGKERYNAVWFSVTTFSPTDNSWVPGSNPESHFLYYRPGNHLDQSTSHVKTWYQGPSKVDLHTHGGHMVLFHNQEVCPLPFILKHYPIRSQEHGERKVLNERLPRYKEEERSKEWHFQYKEYEGKEHPSFLISPEELYRVRRPTTIITLTRFPEIFHRLADSVDKWEPTRRRIVVTSGGVDIERCGWEVIKGVEPFIFARNLNLGIKAAEGDDVLCVNDDVEFTSSLIDELSEASYRNNAAITSPRVLGDGIGLRMAQASYPLEGRWTVADDYIPFVCVFIRREVINTLGLLDEQFDGYGADDVDYGRRALAAGFPSIIVNKKVKHGYGRHNYSSSFKRVMTEPEQVKSASLMLDRLKLKLGVI